MSVIEPKKNNTPLYLLGAIGVMSIVYMIQAGENTKTQTTTNVQAQTESVINLPATNEKVNGLENRLESSIQSINDQINRREIEMRAERDALLEEIRRVKNMDRERIVRLEDLMVEQLNNNNKK